MVTTKDMVQVYVYLRFKCTCCHRRFHEHCRCIDRKAFITAVWEALEDTKNQLIFSYMIACAMFPSSLSAEINFRK